MRTSQPSEPRPGRVARRRAATRARILETAAEAFASAGPEGVRLEQVADDADVARGTLYSFFPTKDELVREVLRPVLERAVEEAEAIAAGPPQQAVDGLLQLYLLLWREHTNPFRLTYRMMERTLGPLEETHGRFLRAVFRILEGQSQMDRLRAGDPVLAARILARVAVPMLELCAAHPDGDRLFVESMRGVLLKDADHGPKSQ